MGEPGKFLLVFSRAERGGGYRRLTTLIGHLTGAACSLVVYSAAPLDLPEHTAVDPRVVKLPARRNEGFIFWALFFLTMPVHLARELWSGGFSAILAVEPLYALVALPGALISGVPLILLLQSSPFPTRQEVRRSRARAFFSRIRDTLGLFCAGRIIVPSEALSAEIVEKHPRLKQRVIVIPPAIPEGSAGAQKSERERSAERLARKRALAERYQFHEKWTLLVTAGELTVRKNFECLIRALAACTNHRLGLIVCGDGPERESLTALMIGLGLEEQIAFTGWVEQPLEVIRGADLLVLPSPYLGMSGLAVEALGAGVPVIGADVRDIREALANDASLLFPPGDVGALAAVIDQITLGKGGLEKAAHRCREHSQRFRFDWAARFLDAIGVVSPAKVGVLRAP